jgi:hypothetical protein
MVSFIARRRRMPARRGLITMVIRKRLIGDTEGELDTEKKSLDKLDDVSRFATISN